MTKNVKNKTQEGLAACELNMEEVWMLKNIQQLSKNVRKINYVSA